MRRLRLTLSRTETMAPRFTTILEALDRREVFKSWAPGTVALDHEGKPTLWYRGSTQTWAANMRKDEDPRHQWRRMEIPHFKMDALIHCERCDRSSLELVDKWLRRQSIDWREEAMWEDLDPKGRTLIMARNDFENSICEGERRNVEGRWVP